jgi:hypothetical protein
MLENPLSNTDISEQRERKPHVHCVNNLGRTSVGYHENQAFGVSRFKTLGF